MAENSTNSITAGKTITCKAAVTWGPKKGLVIEEIEVAPPKAGEVRIRIHYASLCHTDVTFLQLEQGIFPRIFGHEAAGVVESVGNGVTDLKEGDHVIPIFSGECGDCKYCASNKTNLCGKFRVNPMKAVMSYDNKPRFSKDGKDIFHFLSCSTFSEYTVLEEACVVKVPSEAPLDKICLFSCGVSTGLGAVWNTAKVEAGSTVAIFGLGTVGLAVAEGARIAGASRIIGVDIKSEKFIEGKAFGVTEFVNPQEHTKPIQEVLKEMTDGGVDYCFECAGNSNLMYAAFESCHDGWGQAILVGVDDAAKKIIFGCMQFFDGREIKGCTFGGYKGKTQIPGLVQMYLNKELNVERFITHKLPFERIDEAVELLEKGKSLRCVLSLI